MYLYAIYSDNTTPSITLDYTPDPVQAYLTHEKSHAERLLTTTGWKYM